MKIETAIRHCEEYADELRFQVERCEGDLFFEGSMCGMFGTSILKKRTFLYLRQQWPQLLVRLYRLERQLSRLNDEWWNGPKMEEKPVIGEPKDAGLGYMLACMRSGQNAVTKEQEAALGRWKKEQRNEHWTRKKEAREQIKNPKRRVRLSRAR